MQTQHSSPDWHLEISHQWPNRHNILIVLSTMNLQFQDWFVSISLSFWNCGSFISWLQSGLHVVNFYHLVEDSVSVRLNMAQNIICSP